MANKNYLKEKLKKVRKKIFPELKKVKIDLGLINSDTEFMNYGTYEGDEFAGQYYINIDRSMTRAPPKALTVCLSHELAHIYVDKEMNFFLRLLTDKVLRKEHTYRIWDERRVDLMLVERGLGNALMEFEEFAAPMRAKRNGEEGLTKEEVKALMNGKLKRSDILNGCFRDWVYYSLTG